MPVDLGFVQDKATIYRLTRISGVALSGMNISQSR